MEKRSSPFPSLPVLPPITIDDQHHRCLEELNDWISEELCQVDDQDTQQYYTVYKQVFSRVSNSTVERHLINVTLTEFSEKLGA